MGLSYRAVGWNRQKRLYDVALLGGVGGYLLVFVGAGLVLFPHATIETLLLRAFGTAALLLLHVILSIGPLARLDPRFLPLLYNRRHMGVTMFVLAATHATIATIQFDSQGNVNPFTSLLTSNTRWGSVAQFPFEILGLAALAILFLMAATSHDFWLANLTAPVWKALHMLVYAAYALLVLHVALGALQTNTHPSWTVLLGLGVVIVGGLHARAGWKERGLDRAVLPCTDEGFVDVCGVDEIPEKRARLATLSGERVAVFRYDGKVSALSNVCQHQNGPLGEGRILDGCVTCPWHGYQYMPDSGTSPPPFGERVPTFRVRVKGGRVLVDPRPLPAGTRVEPARIETGASHV